MAKATASYEAYINALGARLLSQEGQMSPEIINLPSLNSLTLEDLCPLSTEDETLLGGNSVSLGNWFLKYFLW